MLRSTAWGSICASGADGVRTGVWACGGRRAGMAGGRSDQPGSVRARCLPPGADGPDAATRQLLAHATQREDMQVSNCIIAASRLPYITHRVVDTRLPTGIGAARVSLWGKSGHVLALRTHWRVASEPDYILLC